MLGHVEVAAVGVHFLVLLGYIQRGLVSRVDLVTVFLSMESLDSARATRHLRSRRARLGDSPSIMLGYNCIKKYFVPRNAHKQIIQAPHKHSFKQAGIHDTTDYNIAARLLRVGRDDSTTEPYNTVFGVTVSGISGRCGRRGRH